MRAGRRPHSQPIGEYKERQAAQHRLLIFSIIALIGILLILHADFRTWRLAILVILRLAGGGGDIALRRRPRPRRGGRRLTGSRAG
jgi:Cu/Ag efflux pump CusA